jgi:hypothetical protein
MVAIYIAGFVIFFAVASVAYKASNNWWVRGRTRISPTKLTHGSPVDSVILGSSRGLSRSDLLLENLALRQELLALRARHPKPRRLGAPDSCSELGPVVLAQLEAVPDQEGNPDPS